MKECCPSPHLITTTIGLQFNNSVLWVKTLQEAQPEQLDLGKLKTKTQTLGELQSSSAPNCEEAFNTALQLVRLTQYITLEIYCPQFLVLNKMCLVFRKLQGMPTDKKKWSKHQDKTWM